MEGKATGFSRKYHNECPHKRGEIIVLTSKFLDSSGRNIPFAKVEVQTVRPGTVGRFRRDSIIAEMDGYGNGEHWVGQMRQLYGRRLNDSDSIFHIKFNAVQMDRDAGRRGDVD